MQPSKATRYTFSQELLENLALRSVGVDPDNLDHANPVEIEWEDGDLKIIVPERSA